VGDVRRSRDQRPEPKRLVISPRVVAVLATIARLGVASVREHLVPLHFPEPTTAHRFVARLHGASFVDVHVPHLNAGNLVTIRPKGAELLTNNGHDPGALHVVRKLGAGTTHLLKTNSVRVALVAGARSRDDVEVVEVVSDMDVRRWLGSEARRRDALIPDLLVRLRVAGSELRLLCEVDLGSEATRVWSAKVHAIHERYRVGAAVAGFEAPWRPVLLAGANRLRTLCRVTAEMGGGELWVAGELDAFIADPYGPVLATVAEVARTEHGSVAFELALAPAATPASTAAATAKAGSR
jgi:hypothetical protein